MELKGAILVWFLAKEFYKNKALTKNKHKEKKLFIPTWTKIVDQ
jgi:hypothetical protein